VTFVWLRWFVACALVVVLFPAQAQAFRRSLVSGTAICLFWDEREIPWSLNERGASSIESEELAAAMRRSYDRWEAVECSDFAFREEGRTSADRVGFDDTAENIVVFRRELCEDVVRDEDPCWDDFSCGNAYDCWPFSSGTIAVTTTSYREDTGEIVDADIEFNEAAFLFTTADGAPCRRGQTEGCVSTDLENTAVHEIGHVLGIDHSPVSGSTMYASAPQGETAKRTLAQDDVEAICSIYPAGEPADVCEEAYGLRRPGGGGCTCDSAGGSALLGLLPILAWSLRRRSR
jgi:Matrixin